MNPGEKQAEIYTYEAPWLIYACNWSVRLRSFFLYTRKALHASLFFSLFLSLCIVRWNSNREPLLFSSEWDPNYIHDVVYFMLYTSEHSRAFQLTTTYSSFPPLFRAINVINARCVLKVRNDKKLRLGIGSFLEEYENKVEIVTLDEETGKFLNDPNLRFDHPYPCTKLMFVPDKECQHEDLMATTGDFLRIWKINEDVGGTAKEKANEKEEERENDDGNTNISNNNNNKRNLKKGGGGGGGGGRDTNTEKPSTSGQQEKQQQQQQQNASNKQQEDGKIELRALLANNKNSEFCAPLTSFDWNETNVNRVGTSSIDTTCTVWDIERECVDTQLIAHDKEVHDIAWGGPDVFASASADGSVRVFDLRDKDHSTIIYENPEIGVPLLRLGWNKQDPRYMATFGMDSKVVAIIDIRFPTLPVAELKRHASSVNTLAWAPHSSCHICSAGDDAQALIWDLSAINQLSEGGLDPVLAYEAGAEINQLQWSATQPDWIAIAFSQSLQILRV